MNSGSGARRTRRQHRLVKGAFSSTLRAWGRGRRRVPHSERLPRDRVV